MLERLSSDLGKGDVLQSHRGRLCVGHQGVLLLSRAAVWSVRLVDNRFLGKSNIEV